jgi:hypothetical protein
MKYGKILAITVVIVALLASTLTLMNARQDDPAADPESHEEPAVVEAIEGSDISKVTLTQRASERLDIQTADVTEETVDGAARIIVPYSAVIYETDGSTWVYTSPEPLVFVRMAITVEKISGDIAILTEGPEVGTQVVSVGGAMLYGTEHGVGH